MAGHWGLQLETQFRTLGLVLFIYAVALQAGPSVFRSFRSVGLRLSIAALAMVSMAFLSASIAGRLMGLDPAMAAGLFTGSMTSTPGLAVAVEATESQLAAAAYGIAYIGGVLGVTLAIGLLPKIFRVNMRREEQSLEQENRDANPPLVREDLEITNTNLFGKKLAELKLDAISPVTITRLLRRDSGSPILVGPDTVFAPGDTVRLVGRADDLAGIRWLMGKPTRAREIDRSLKRQRVIVSCNALAGRSLASLNIRQRFEVQISRIERGGVELPVDPSLQLLLGDVVVAVGSKGELKRLAEYLGNHLEATFAASILPLLAGIVAGFLLGQIPVYLPFLGRIALGTSGGVLLSGLILGHRYKSGPLIWAMPRTSINFIRHLGLALFLAVVGTQAGAILVPTLSAKGFDMILVGVIITFVPLVVGTLLCRYLLKLDLPHTLGVLAGGMTSTPGLAVATSMPGDEFASRAYATVYPIALIAMIITTRLLVMICS